MYDIENLNRIFTSPFILTFLEQKFEIKGFFFITEIKLLSLYEELRKQTNEDGYEIVIDKINNIVLNNQYDDIINDFKNNSDLCDILKNKYNDYDKKKLDEFIDVFIKENRINLFTQIVDNYFNPLFNFFNDNEVSNYLGFNKNKSNPIEDNFSFVRTIYFILSNFNINEFTQYLFNFRTIYFFMKYKEEEFGIDKYFDLQNSYYSGMVNKQWNDKKSINKAYKSYDEWTKNLLGKIDKNSRNYKRIPIKDIIINERNRQIEEIKKVCDEKGIDINILIDNYMEYLRLYKLHKEKALQIYKENIEKNIDIIIKETGIPIKLIKDKLKRI